MDNSNDKYYDINWSKVKTIKDIKAIMKVLVNKLQIDHSDEEDINVYESLKHLLIDTDNDKIG